MCIGWQPLPRSLQLSSLSLPVYWIAREIHVPCLFLFTFWNCSLAQICHPGFWTGGATICIWRVNDRQPMMGRLYLPLNILFSVILNFACENHVSVLQNQAKQMQCTDLHSKRKHWISFKVKLFVTELYLC